MIELGRTYKDKITGFEGVATGYVQYITGCNQALLAKKASDDGTLKNTWFDEQRLDVMKAKKIVIENGVNPGCDDAAPIR